MYPQYHQMTLDDYDFPFGKLDPENEWVKLAALVPWDVAEEEYAKQFVNNGHPAGQHPTLPVDSASTSAHDRVRSSPPLQNCSGAPNRHPEPVSVPFAGALIGFPAGDLSMCFPEQIFSQ